MPKYAKIGHKGLNKQKNQKKKKKKKKKRFLETVGIGGMSLVFLGRMQRVESCHLFFFLPVNVPNHQSVIIVTMIIPLMVNSPSVVVKYH